MMEKQPFTTTGLEAVLQSLYALTDGELFIKAAAIAADFRTWIIDHFILSDTQRSFLLNLSNQFIVGAATDSRDFVLQRLPIVLLKETPPAEEEEKPRGKIIEKVKQTEQRSGIPISYESAETLTFIISFPLIN